MSTKPTATSVIRGLIYVTASFVAGALALVTVAFGVGESIRSFL